MANILKSNKEYKVWLSELKLRIRRSQLKASVKVNTELINLYWGMGKDIVEKQEKSKWGDGFIKQLSVDLKKEFPGIQGFSLRNIKYIRQWHLFYNQKDTIRQQAVAQSEFVQQLVAQIPWGHNLKIISKCKSVDEAFFYINKR